MHYRALPSQEALLESFSISQSENWFCVSSEPRLLRKHLLPNSHYIEGIYSGHHGICIFIQPCWNCRYYLHIWRDYSVEMTWALVHFWAWSRCWWWGAQGLTPSRVLKDGCNGAQLRPEFSQPNLAQMQTLDGLEDATNRVLELFVMQQKLSSCLNLISVEVGKCNLAVWSKKEKELILGEKFSFYCLRNSTKVVGCVSYASFQNNS